MKRYIYAFDSIDAACKAVVQLRDRGVDDRYISLIARRDIHDRLANAPADLIQALGWGAAAGLGVAIIAMSVLQLGPAVGSAMLLTFLIGGAILGALMSAPIGPEEGPRTHVDEVEAGRTLLVVDSDSENEALVTGALADDTDNHLIWQSVKRTVAVR